MPVDKALQMQLVGATVARKYGIRRIMGSGSMGVVCEAEHLEIGKRVAIKVIDAALAARDDIALRFRQEARAASLVESQHIVQVYDVGSDEDLGLYLVMEYLTGEDLSQLLAREKRLSTDAAVRIAVQVARGLAKAHEAGVVHRDLKPANIFLAKREEDESIVKILDFGISKVIDASRAESAIKLTRAGAVVGTPQYMSPEQAQGLGVDERTDVWALGLVLYEMLAGRVAYPELPTYEAFIINLVSRPPDSLSKVAPWVPSAVAEVVHQAIEHDVDRRIPSTSELARRLLHAHPVDGLRPAPAVPSETFDTWADQTVRSPFPDDDATRSDDPMTIDIDVTVSPPTRPGSPLLEPPAAGALTRSGVRAPSVESVDRAAEDAPQFFDRRALENVASLSPGHVGSVRTRVPQPAADPHRGEGALAPSPANAAARFPLGWMAMVFIALGLVVVAALALR